MQFACALNWPYNINTQTQVINVAFYCFLSPRETVLASSPLSKLKRWMWRFILSQRPPWLLLTFENKNVAFYFVFETALTSSSAFILLAKSRQKANSKTKTSFKNCYQTKSTVQVWRNVFLFFKSRVFSIFKLKKGMLRQNILFLILFSYFGKVSHQKNTLLPTDDRHFGYKHKIL
jgi:hypothetical protein